MADVIEVIHQINYEVNDAALQNATAAIKAQIAELNSLNNALKGYQQQLNNTRNITALDELSRKIDTVSKQVEASVGKAKGIMEQFGSGIIKGLGLDTSIEGAVEKFFKPLGDHLFKVKEGGDGAGTSIASAATSFLPFGGAVKVLLPVLLELVSSFVDIDNSTKNVNNSTADIIESSKRYGEIAAEEITQLFLLKTRIEDVGLKYSDRKTAINSLLELFPTYFEKLTKEEILAGKVGDAYQRATANLFDRTKLEIFQEGLKGELSKLLAEGEKIRNLAAIEGVELRTQNSKLPGIDKYFSDVMVPGSSFMPVADNTAVTARPNGRSAASQPSAELNKALLSYQLALSKVESSLQKIAALSFATPSANKLDTEISTHGRVKDKPIKRPKPIGYLNSRPVADIRSAIEAEKPPVADKRDVPAFEYTEPYKPSKLEKLLFGDTANEQNAQKRRQAEIKKSIDAYQTLATTAAQAFQDIYAAQVKALDAEIEIRKKRVDAAMKLAERGNTEALRIEEEKLKQAEKKREEYARKQQIINSALAVSNAVVAVASAASQSGAGALVIVPAVIAAIIAGYAAISAATKESSAQAFADGVVGFKGKGGPRDDANWVRISSGESVITAAGTGANRHVLEAINKGVQFRMVDPRIHATMPMLKAPDMNSGNTHYASKQSMKNLEDKLDGVINAIEQNSFKQDVFFNEQGVGMLTERAVKRNNRRFK